MDLSKYETSLLEKTLKDHLNWLNWSRSLVSKQGGWIMWDGDREEMVEKEVECIKSELHKRKSSLV